MTPKSLKSEMSHELIQIRNVKYNESLFDAFLTNTPLDKLFSVKDNGGIPKATNWMIVGDPGVGKSSVVLDVLANVKQSGAKVLFISAEMNRVDLYLYVQRYPKFGKIDILFPQEIDDSTDIRKAIEDVLDLGWDVVMIDSFIELQSTIKENVGMSSNSVEKYILNLMFKHNMAQNKLKKYTSFLNIQQVNKGGVFTGSNKLKHATTGMMEIRFVDDTQEDRYIVFTKNRRGDVGKQLYFDLSTKGDVKYDYERFKKNEKIKELKKKEKEKLNADDIKFSELFKS